MAVRTLLERRFADVAIALIYHNPDGIADWYELTLPQVFAALAYYY
jgi:uncharacterized protein (DUF433 family)